MHELIGRHVKQRLVAENRSLDDDRGDGGHDGRAEQRRVQVPDDFLERKQHGGDGGVEGGGQRAGRANGHEVAYAIGRKLHPAADDGRQSGADLHGRPFAPHRVTRSDAQDSGDELANRHSRANHAARQVVRRLGLRHAAPSHVGKHLRQQHARHQTHERRHEQQPAARWRQAEQSVARLLDGDREDDGREPGHHADDDGEHEKDLMLPQAQRLRADRFRHGVPPPWRRPMRTSASSSGIGGPQWATAYCSTRETRSTPASISSSESVDGRVSCRSRPAQLRSTEPARLRQRFATSHRRCTK